MNSNYRIDTTHLPAPKRLALSEVDPPALGIDQTDIFSSLRSVKADQIAVKSDDATVNTDVWLYYFLNGGVLLSVALFSMASRLMTI